MTRDDVLLEQAYQQVLEFGSLMRDLYTPEQLDMMKKQGFGKKITRPSAQPQQPQQPQQAAPQTNVARNLRIQKNPLGPLFQQALSQSDQSDEKPQQAQQPQQAAPKTNVFTGLPIQPRQATAQPQQAAPPRPQNTAANFNDLASRAQNLAAANPQSNAAPQAAATSTPRPQTPAQNTLGNPQAIDQLKKSIGEIVQVSSKYPKLVDANFMNSLNRFAQRPEQRGAEQLLQMLRNPQSVRGLDTKTIDKLKQDVQNAFQFRAMR